MAILWQKTNDDHWEPTELFNVTRLADDFVEPAEATARQQLETHTYILSSVDEDETPTWLILTPPTEPVWLNGQPVSTGIRVLADRDAIRLPGLPTRYFSTESLAEVVAFPGPEPVICARCKLEIAIGDEAVLCPGCRTWHHSQVADDANCWLYTSSCAALCGQSTDFEAGFRWTPAEL